jgi:hypothetical protein
MKYYNYSCASINHFSYKALFIFLVPDIPDNGRRFESLFFWWSNAFRNEFGQVVLDMEIMLKMTLISQLTFK